MSVIQLSTRRGLKCPKCKGAIPELRPMVAGKIIEKIPTVRLALLVLDIECPHCGCPLEIAFGERGFEKKGGKPATVTQLRLR